MSLIQSFWSEPAKWNRWGIGKQVEANLWIAALSCVYTKKIGASLIMHTDDFGKELLKHLPYTDLRLTLNQIPKDTPPGQWAVSKMYAQMNSKLGDIHIDNDVFIKKKSLYESMCNSKYDLIVQSIEKTDGHLYKHPCGVLKEIPNLPMDLDFPLAYNCGVVGFKDKQLKEKYLSDYFKFYEIVTKNPKILDLMHSNTRYTLELLIEQQHLFEVSSNNHVLAVLLDKSNADNVGYQHLIGSAKYVLIDKVKEVLKKLAPDIYEKTKQIIEAYVKKDSTT